MVTPNSFYISTIHVLSIHTMAGRLSATVGQWGSCAEPLPNAPPLSLTNEQWAAMASGTHRRIRRKTHSMSPHSSISEVGVSEVGVLSTHCVFGVPAVGLCRYWRELQLRRNGDLYSETSCCSREMRSSLGNKRDGDCAYGALIRPPSIPRPCPRKRERIVWFPQRGEMPRGHMNMLVSGLVVDARRFVLRARQDNIIHSRSGEGTRLFTNSVGAIKSSK